MVRASRDRLDRCSGAERPATVEERLGKRERSVGWVVFGLFLGALAALGGLVLVAVPLIVIAFPLTLSAVAVILAIGWWRERRAG